MSYVIQNHLAWVPKRPIKQFIEAIVDLGVLNQLSSPSRFHLKGCDTKWAPSTSYK